MEERRMGDGDEILYVHPRKRLSIDVDHDYVLLIRLFPWNMRLLCRLTRCHSASQLVCMDE